MSSQIVFIAGGMLFFLLMVGFVTLTIRLLCEKCEEFSIDVSWRGIRVTFVRKQGGIQLH